MEILKRSDCIEDLGTDGKIDFKWLLRKQVVMVGKGSIC
jgi:hypothetical protein